MIKILIADDEFIERRVLSRAISSHYGDEATIQCVVNGKKAVDVATLWDPDVILMDIEMPGLNGIDAARDILLQRPSAKIIFVTAYSLFEYAHEAVKLGIIDYILKPVDEHAVTEATDRALRQLEAQRQLEGFAQEASKMEKGEGSDRASQLIAKVLKYLKQNYMRYDLSLEKVSDILNINASYLSVLFKRCTGVNFVSFVTDLKINAAKELLKDPLRSANEIAEMVGYESASYFTRAFKKHTGMTPTEYRQSCAAKGDFK
jgi:YesN/AraC family two-component response regulator